MTSAVGKPSAVLIQLHLLQHHRIFERNDTIQHATHYNNFSNLLSAPSRLFQRLGSRLHAFNFHIMAQEDNAKRLEEANKMAKENPAKAEQTYQDIMNAGPGQTEATSRVYEGALIGLGELYRDQKKAQDLAQLLSQVRSVLSKLAKAKTSKLGELRRL